MAINTFGIVALGLEVAGCHSGHLPQSFEIVFGDGVLVVVGAAGVGACVGAVEEVDVAEFELFDAFDVFVGDGVVDVVDALAEPVAVDSGRRFGGVGFGAGAGGGGGGGGDKWGGGHGGPGGSWGVGFGGGSCAGGDFFVCAV